MYFGYGQIWQFTFVPVGFAIVMATFVALALVYTVGASRGPRAAARHASITSALFVAAALADLGWAVASGTLSAFVLAFGLSPLVEMIALALLCVGSMWFMAMSYVNSRMRGI